MRVYFVQPKNFNRTDKRTNPFFDPVIDVCEENNIEYKIYNPGRKSKIGYPRSRVRDSRHLRRFVSFFAKYFGRFIQSGEEYDIDKMAGRIWNVLTFGRDRADIYITVATELYGALPGINPNARVVDIMHGIFCPGHWVYLEEDGSISKFLKKAKEREVWVTGAGYRDLFLRRGNEVEWVSQHIKVIGDIFGHTTRQGNFMNNNESTQMLITLQLTNGCTFEENKFRYERVVSFLKEHSANGLWRGNPILVKHHPRYNGCYDIAPMVKQFPKLKFISDSLNDIAKQVSINITVDSTSAFDMAAYGIPTYFLYEKNDKKTRGIWDETFEYPYFDIPFKTLIDMYDANKIEVNKVMFKWFSRYYIPIDKKRIAMELNDATKAFK